MRIQASNTKLKTKRFFSGEAPKLNEQKIHEYYNSTNLTKAKIKRFIDNLDISADAKSHLFQLSELTMKAGQFIVRIGKKILDIVIFLFREYPNTTFGLILGCVVGALITAIPVIGFLLGPLFSIIAPLLGIGLGVIEDIKNKALKHKINETIIEFENLKTNDYVSGKGF